MKIAFFTDNFYPELSGISDSVLEISKELSNNGHEIRIYAPKYSKADYDKSGYAFNEIDLGQNVTIKRLKSFRYRNSPTGQARLVVPSLWFLFDVYRYNPDIIHFHLPFGMGINALLTAKIFRKPLVGTSHTPVTEFLAYSPLKTPWMHTLTLRMVSWFYNRCDFVSAPSQTVLDEMTENGLKRKHSVVSNPIDICSPGYASESEKNILKEALGLKGNVILYTGRLAKEKNIDLIIKALAEIKEKISNTVLVVTGHGKEESNLKKTVNELGLDNEVKFVGTVDMKTLIKYHQLADVFAIMSTAESQSISLMRSFSAGVPAVVADARALPEYVGVLRGFAVSTGGHKELAEKLLVLLENTELRRSMGMEARHFVERISTEKIASAWEQIYSDVLYTK